jgi:2-dehydropantoate 2-reductase
VTLKAEVQSVIAEVISVARAAGVPLPENVGVESLEKGRAFPPETKTSFQRDFERVDKPDERDLFAGALMRIGGNWELRWGRSGELRRSWRG